VSQRAQDWVGVLVMLFGGAACYIGAFVLKSTPAFFVGLGVVAFGGIICAPDIFKTGAKNFGEVVGPYLPTYGRRSYDIPPEDKK
jgi:hypothetical protein